MLERRKRSIGEAGHSLGKPDVKEEIAIASVYIPHQDEARWVLVILKTTYTFCLDIHRPERTDDRSQTIHVHLNINKC